MDQKINSFLHGTTNKKKTKEGLQTGKQLFNSLPFEDLFYRCSILDTPFFTLRGGYSDGLNASNL